MFLVLVPLLQQYHHLRDFERGKIIAYRDFGLSCCFGTTAIYVRRVWNDKVRETQEGQLVKLDVPETSE